MQDLNYFDAVLAITDSAINTGFKRVFGTSGAFDDLEIDIDPDHGVKVTASFGAPTITLLSSNAAAITLPITSGTYHAAGKYNLKTKQIDTVTTTLDGKSLSFHVDVVRLVRERAQIHEANFTIQQLYLDLTSIRAIDTSDFPVSIDDDADVGQIVSAWVAQAHKVSPTSNKARLSAGHITVPAVFDPTGSPLLPSHGSFSVTLAPPPAGGSNIAVSGDLNFLLMMGGRSLPSAATAGTFASPWVPRPVDGRPPEHDGVFVISDFLLLEAIAVPILRDKFKLDSSKFSLTRDANGHGRISLTTPHPLGDDVTMTACNVWVDRGGSGEIVFEVHAEKSERLQIKHVDLSVLAVIIPQIRTLALKVSPNAKGDLAFSISRDQTEKQTVRIDPNFTVSGIADLAKYLMLVPAVLLGPIFGVVYAATTAIADAIKSATTDEDEVGEYLNGLDGTLKESANASVELPGTSVLAFSASRFAGPLLMFDADYIDPPELIQPEHPPFSIPDFPRMGEGDRPVATSDRTTPVVVGEALMTYRMVNDPDLVGRQATENPYYILRREQYWKRLYHKGWQPHTEARDTSQWRVSMSAEDTTSMSKTAGMRITAGCRLAFNDYVSAEVQTEIANELRMEIDHTARSEVEQTHTEEVTHQATDCAYTVSIWSIVDRFTLLRADRYCVKTWEYVHGDDHVEVDVHPPKEKTSSGGEFDPSSFETSLNGDGSGAMASTAAPSNPR